MRLPDDYKTAIKEGVKKFFGEKAKVLLFGSRVDDSKKDGDIDLYIIPEKFYSNEEYFNKKIELLAFLYGKIGEQKIDIIIKGNCDKNIELEAIKNGIEL